ncbi:MAG TPA: 30S ribosomal protein S8e [Candidatus Nanoarchaeia archaeon]|nr:30S ribosomal protein S8e [Candidatus Nanoarchaeia archaeon]
MARSQERAQRKVSGGRYHQARTKRKYELARFESNTKISDKGRAKTIRTLGGNVKQLLLTVQDINVADRQGKSQKTGLITVVENPANPNLVRRNIITKGAIVETKLGKVRVTSRPGQEGSLSGVLV